MSGVSFGSLSHFYSLYKITIVYSFFFHKASMLLEKRAFVSLFVGLSSSSPPPIRRSEETGGRVKTEMPTWGKNGQGRASHFRPVWGGGWQDCNTSHSNGIKMVCEVSLTYGILYMKEWGRESWVHNRHCGKVLLIKCIFVWLETVFSFSKCLANDSLLNPIWSLFNSPEVWKPRSANLAEATIGCFIEIGLCYWDLAGQT